MAEPAVGVLGLGHIGGSLALALPGSIAWSRSAETRAAAAAAGVVVVDSVAEVVAAADIVVVAAALPALEAVVDQVAEAEHPDRRLSHRHARRGTNPAA